MTRPGLLLIYKNRNRLLRFPETIDIEIKNTMVTRLSEPRDKREIVSDRVYDARGLLCPLPIIRASEEIRRMETGEVLEVISDDPGIQEDMPAWCRSAGHCLLALTREGAVYHSYVRKE